MALPSRLIRSSHQKGFTIAEVLITLAILSVLFSIGLPVGWDFYTTYQFDSETQTFVAALEQARSAALVNRNQSAHGVYFDTNDFIVFQGSSFATRNVTFDKKMPRNSIITISGSNEIVFTSLSAETASSTYNFAFNTKNRTIYVTTQGGIIY